MAETGASVTIDGSVLQDFASRLGQLEQAGETTQNEVHGLRQELRAAMSESREQFDRLGDRLSTRTKTEWSTLAAWATVILVLASGIGTMAIWPLMSQQEEWIGYVRELGERHVDHIDDGHPQRIEERIGGVTDHLSDMVEDISLQLDQLRSWKESYSKETAPMDANQSARIEAIERELYRMGRRGRPLDEDL